MGNDEARNFSWVREVSFFLMKWFHHKLKPYWQILLCCPWVKVIASIYCSTWTLCPQEAEPGYEHGQWYSSKGNGHIVGGLGLNFIHNTCHTDFRSKYISWNYEVLLQQLSSIFSILCHYTEDKIIHKYAFQTFCSCMFVYLDVI